MCTLLSAALVPVSACSRFVEGSEDVAPLPDVSFRVADSKTGVREPSDAPAWADTLDMASEGDGASAPLSPSDAADAADLEGPADSGVVAGSLDASGEHDAPEPSVDTSAPATDGSVDGGDDAPSRSGPCDGAPLGAECDGGDPCWVLTTCQPDGSCGGGFPDSAACSCAHDDDCAGLDDGDRCNGLWTCDERGGLCVLEVPDDC